MYKLIRLCSVPLDIRDVNSDVITVTQLSPIEITIQNEVYMICCKKFSVPEGSNDTNVFDLQLEVDPSSYLESILNVTKFGMTYSFGRLHTKVNKTEWITHGRPAIVNAFYSSIENSIRK
jgi:hypothetical protein